MIPGQAWTSYLTFKQRRIFHCKYINCYDFRKVSTLVQFSSVEDDIYAFGKAHMRSTPSLRRFPSVAFETVLTLVAQTSDRDDVNRMVKVRPLRL